MRRLLLSLVLVAGVGCSTQGDVAGDSADVAGFRGGPDRTGTSPELAPQSPEIVWEIDTGFRVISSPVARGDELVARGGDGVLRRIDPNGEVVWQFDAGDGESSPLLIDSRVAAVTSDSVVMLDLANGELVWESEVGNVGRSSPTASQDRLLLGVGDELQALDLTAGDVLWQAPLGSRTASSPAATGDVVLIGTSDNVVSAHATADGSLLWTHEFGDTPEDLRVVASGVVAAPAIGDGVAYVGSVNGQFAALSVEEGTPIWQTDLGSPIYSSAAIGTLVYLTIADGSAIALELETGDVVWRTGMGEPSYSSPLLTDDSLVATTEEGLIFGLDPADGAELWRLTIGVDGDFMASSPTLTVGDTGPLLVVGSNDGRLLGIGSSGP